MPSLLVKVKSRMAIYAHEKVRTLLDGEYGSVFKGRSMDFDDLREYIPGDDVNDIDWKATARSGQTLIKRYIAIRKHNILFVVGTGRAMSAMANKDENKRDVAIMVTGALGSIAVKHGDLVALVSGTDAASQYMQLKGTNEHLERILQHIHKQTSSDGAANNLNRQLDYIARSIRRKTMLVVVSDTPVIDAECEHLIRRLRAQHEVMWITISDLNPLDRSLLQKTLIDVETDASLPVFIRKSKQLVKEYGDQTNTEHSVLQKTLQRLGISHQIIASEQEVVPALYKLLEKQRYAK